jgi:hypothetical protein
MIRPQRRCRMPGSTPRIRSTALIHKPSNAFRQASSEIAANPPAGGPAGIDHEDINATELVGRLPQHRVHGVRLRKIGGKGNRANLLSGGFEPHNIAGADRDFGALRSERHRNGLAKPARGAGDQRCFVVQAEVHIRSRTGRLHVD